MTTSATDTINIYFNTDVLYDQLVPTEVTPAPATTKSKKLKKLTPAELLVLGTAHYCGYSISKYDISWLLHGIACRLLRSLVKKGVLVTNDGREYDRWSNVKPADWTKPLTAVAIEFYKAAVSARSMFNLDALAPEHDVIYQNAMAILNGNMELPPELPPEEKPFAPVTMVGKNELLCEYGYELTYHQKRNWDIPGDYVCKKVLGRAIPPKPDPFWGVDDDKIQRRIFTRLRETVLEKLAAKVSHWDLSTNEIELHNTKPYGDIKSLEKFYKEANKTFNLLKLPVHPTLAGEEGSSGGGHLHINIKGYKWTAELLREVYNEFMKYPFLNWVFNDPNDDYNANWIGYSAVGFNKPFKKSTRNRWTSETVHPDHLGQFHHTKGEALSFNPDKGVGTLEFRMFEMPWDWAEQKAHILFVDKFMKYVCKNYNANQGKLEKLTTIDDVKHPDDWTFYESKIAFYKLLKKLGLKKEDYEIFVERNLTERFRTDIPGYQRR